MDAYGRRLREGGADAVIQGLISLMRVQTMRPPMHERIPYSSCELDINDRYHRLVPSPYTDE
jgi:hypothetical protein